MSGHHDSRPAFDLTNELRYENIQTLIDRLERTFETQGCIPPVQTLFSLDPKPGFPVISGSLIILYFASKKACTELIV